MSLSPNDASTAASYDYVDGWVAVYRMVNEGLSWSGYERNSAFLNLGTPRFADVSAVSGLDFDDDARGMAMVDWDLDGRLDLWLHNRTGPRARLMRNAAPRRGSFVALSLEGRSVNRDAIGARVELHLSNHTVPLIETLRAGEGYLSQSSKWLHFGVPHGATLKNVVVRWPGAKAETFTGVELDRRYVLVQGAGQARLWTVEGLVSPLPSAPVKAPPLSQRARIIFVSRPPLPTLSYTDGTGQSQSISLKTPGPMLVNLWASWCPNCVTELKGWAQHAEAFRKAGVRVIALSVDDEKTRDAARTFFAELGVPFDTGFAPTELVERVDVLQRAVLERDRNIPLPTSLLVDPQGRVRVFYKGPVEAETVLADLALLKMDAVALRDAACPFPGQWLVRPPGTDYATLIQEYAFNGHPSVAAEIFSMARETPGALSSAQSFRGGLRLGAALVRAGRFDEAIAVFRQVVEENQDSADAHNDLANALAEAGRGEEAVHHFETALRLRPKHPDTLVSLAVVQMRLKRNDEAEKRLKEALALYPENVTAHNALGSLMASIGRHDDAETHLKEALRIAPAHLSATLNLAGLYSKLNRHTEAIELLRRALAVDPDNVRGLILLGWSLQQTRQWDECIKVYEKSLKLHPDDPETTFNLGLMHLRKGNTASAEALAVRLDKLRPEMAKKLRELASRPTGGASPGGP